MKSGAGLVVALTAKGCGRILIQSGIVDVVTADLTEPVTAFPQAGQCYVDLVQFIRLAAVHQFTTASSRLLWLPTQRDGPNQSAFYIGQFPGQCPSLCFKRIPSGREIHLFTPLLNLRPHLTLLES